MQRWRLEMQNICIWNGFLHLEPQNLHVSQPSPQTRLLRLIRKLPFRRSHAVLGQGKADLQLPIFFPARRLPSARGHRRRPRQGLKEPTRQYAIRGLLLFAVFPGKPAAYVS